MRASFSPTLPLDVMDSLRVWHRRAKMAVHGIINLIWVAVIYLSSELIIWGISRVLATWSLQFFSTSVGMILIFIAAMAAHLLWRNTDQFYHAHIKAKVDFINTHLGVGFTVPMIMLKKDEILGGSAIARIVANFFLTNLVLWSSVYVLALGLCACIAWLRNRNTAPEPYTEAIRTPSHPGPTPLNVSWVSDTPVTVGHQATAADQSRSKELLQVGHDEAERTLEEEEDGAGSSPTLIEKLTDSPVWGCLKAIYPIVLSFCCVFFIGIPVAASLNDHRVLDGCALWFTWISSLRLQQGLKRYAALVAYPAPPACAPSHKRSPRVARLRGAVATLVNPVLLTTLLMTAYTRAKARAAEATTAVAVAAAATGAAGQARATTGEAVGVDVVLRWFSAGTPLYELWTAKLDGRVVPGNAGSWFGAGDAALSLLECGVVVWGFKLYECRGQLFSVAGLLTAIISAAAALSNVFLSTLMGRALGLQEPEALAFAARSTTLALAKPSIEAIHGNSVVNAALVVSNGILGQLMYPFLLDKLGVDTGESNDEESGTRRESACALLERDPSSPSMPGHGQRRAEEQNDSPATIAVGAAIGVNGAAMGVAYLYEKQSRAAPYAALAMSVAGLMTVVFTTVDPFQSVLLSMWG